MRGWLVRTVIEGEELASANAAWLIDPAITDVLLGTINEPHRAYLLHEVRSHQRLEDLPRFDDALLHPSVLQQIATALGTDLETLPDLDGRAIAASMSPRLASTVAAFMDSIGEYAIATAAHAQAISEYLVKFPAVTSPPRQLPVSTTLGVGGRTHDLTQSLIEMRRAPNGASVLREALTLKIEDPIADGLKAS